MFSISINDQWREFSAPLSLAQALQLFSTEQQLSPGQFAVAINGEFVPRTQYDRVMLQDGDTLDIVSPVGGG